MSQSWTQDPILTVEHLSMRFGGLIAVDDVSFTVGRKDITALIGPNGAGKTTVFNCLTGFYKPSEGRIAMRHGGSVEYLLERMDDFRISSIASNVSETPIIFVHVWQSERLAYLQALQGVFFSAIKLAQQSVYLAKLTVCRCHRHLILYVQHLC